MLIGTRQTVLVDGPSADSAFPFEGRTAGQAPEIDGVVLLRNRRLAPGRFVPGRFVPGRFVEVDVVEVDGYELVAE
jgi:tRNA A37 methylthiotransferase MiaB